MAAQLMLNSPATLPFALMISDVYCIFMNERRKHYYLQMYEYVTVGWCTEHVVSIFKTKNEAHVFLVIFLVTDKLIYTDIILLFVIMFQRQSDSMLFS